jgi:hypothetical protein
VTAFAGLPEQHYAARMLDAALERPAHAYLLSGPAGSGKGRYADRFAAALLETELGRVERRTHPDLFVLEPEGQGILVEGARRLRRDLYLRPYEAARRVYLILDAHLLRDESANALLKSIEEPPEYGVFVLVSDHAGRMLPTILSRVQTVPFRRFPAAALEAAVSDPLAARAALGSLTRAEELAHDPAAAGRRSRPPTPASTLPRPPPPSWRRRASGPRPSRPRSARRPPSGWRRSTTRRSGGRSSGASTTGRSGPAGGRSGTSCGSPSTPSDRGTATSWRPVWEPVTRW